MMIRKVLLGWILAYVCISDQALSQASSHTELPTSPIFKIFQPKLKPDVLTPFYTDPDAFKLIPARFDEHDNTLKFVKRKKRSLKEDQEGDETEVLEGEQKSQVNRRGKLRREFESRYLRKLNEDGSQSDSVSNVEDKQKLLTAYFKESLFQFNKTLHDNKVKTDQDLQQVSQQNEQSGKEKDNSSSDDQEAAESILYNTAIRPPIQDSSSKKFKVNKSMRASDEYSHQSNYAEQKHSRTIGQSKSNGSKFKPSSPDPLPNTLHSSRGLTSARNLNPEQTAIITDPFKAFEKEIYKSQLLRDSAKLIREGKWMKSRTTEKSARAASMKDEKVSHNIIIVAPPSTETEKTSRRDVNTAFQGRGDKLLTSPRTRTSSTKNLFHQNQISVQEDNSTQTSLSADGENLTERKYTGEEDILNPYFSYPFPSRHYPKTFDHLYTKHYFDDHPYKHPFDEYHPHFHGSRIHGLYGQRIKIHPDGHNAHKIHGPYNRYIPKYLRSKYSRFYRPHYHLDPYHDYKDLGDGFIPIDYKHEKYLHDLDHFKVKHHIDEILHKSKGYVSDHYAPYGVRSHHKHHNKNVHHLSHLSPYGHKHLHHDHHSDKDHYVPKHHDHHHKGVDYIHGKHKHNSILEVIKEHDHYNHLHKTDKDHHDRKHYKNKHGHKHKKVHHDKYNKDHDHKHHKPHHDHIHHKDHDYKYRKDIGDHKHHKDHHRYKIHDDHDHKYPRRHKHPKPHHDHKRDKHHHDHKHLDDHHDHKHNIDHYDHKHHGDHHDHKHHSDHYDHKHHGDHHDHKHYKDHHDHRHHRDHHDQYYRKEHHRTHHKDDDYHDHNIHHHRSKEYRNIVKDHHDDRYETKSHDDHHKSRDLHNDHDHDERDYHDYPPEHNRDHHFRQLKFDEDHSIKSAKNHKTPSINIKEQIDHILYGEKASIPLRDEHIDHLRTKEKLPEHLFKEIKDHNDKHPHDHLKKSKLTLSKIPHHIRHHDPLPFPRSPYPSDHLELSRFRSESEFIDPLIDFYPHDNLPHFSKQVTKIEPRHDIKKSNYKPLSQQETQEDISPNPHVSKTEFPKFGYNIDHQFDDFPAFGYFNNRTTKQ